MKRFKDAFTSSSNAVPCKHWLTAAIQHNCRDRLYEHANTQQDGMRIKQYAHLSTIHLQLKQLLVQDIHIIFCGRKSFKYTVPFILSPSNAA
jgi:hypothetical protein